MVVHNALLCMSLATFFLSGPGPGFELSVGLQFFGPLLGSPVLGVISIVWMAKRRIGLASGLGGLALLTVVSLVCLAKTMPVFMGI